MGGKPGKPRFSPKGHKFQYDMVIIGGGPGGITCAREASKLGAKVAVCDFTVPTPRGNRWGLGGTSVNCGCIPKYLMRQASIVLKDMKVERYLHGWSGPTGVETFTQLEQLYNKDNVNWDGLIKSIQKVVQVVSYSCRVQLDDDNVTVYDAFASFKSPHEILLLNPDGTEETISGQCIVISVGSRPKYLDFPGATETDDICITSDDLFSLPYPPGRTLVIGEGFDQVSAECVSILNNLGFETKFMPLEPIDSTFEQLLGVQSSKYIAPKEIKLVNKGGAAFSAALGAAGDSETAIHKPIKHTSASVATVPTIRVSFEDSKGQGEIFEDYNTVLLTVGRTPSTEALELGTVKVRMDEEGYIITDQFDCTNIPHIYAIGDCAKDRPQKSAAAMKAGQFLARRIYSSFAKAVDYDMVPEVVFATKEYAFCGVNLEEAIETYGKGNVEVYRNAKDETIKYIMICAKTGKRQEEQVIGLHCFGPKSAELIVGFSLAIKKQCLREDFLDLIAIPGTTAEYFTNMKEYSSMPTFLL